MASRRDWLETGLAVLSEEGAPGLTIERLCGRLELTKGSFYHHFKGMGGFRTALLDHFERECTTRYIESAERSAGPARDRLWRLLELILADEGRHPGLEAALRAWALQDAEVRAVQERVDEQRLGYLRALWQQCGGERAAAEPMARLLYLVMIGAGHLLPPLSPDDLREVYRPLLALVPEPDVRAAHALPSLPLPLPLPKERI